MKFDLIYADPPWRYNSRSNHKTRFRGGASGHYDLMSMADIKSLDIKSIVSDNAIMFMWCTFPYLKDQLEVFEAWGFTYKTVGFTWIKTNLKNTNQFFGVGYYTKCLSGKSQLYIKSKNTDEILLTSIETLFNLLDYNDYQIWSRNGWVDITNIVKNTNTNVVSIDSQLTKLELSPNHKLLFKIPQSKRIKGTDKRIFSFDTRFDEVSYIQHKISLKSYNNKGSINLLFNTIPIQRDLPINILNGLVLDYELGWIIGLFCAEGNYSKNQMRYSLCSDEYSFYERIKNKIESLNLPGDRYFNSTIKVKLHKVKNSNAIVVYFSSKIIKNIISEFVTGTGAHKKRLNIQKLLNTSVEFRRGLWDGILDGDGYKAQGKYQLLKLCNNNLILDIRKLAHSIGVPTFYIPQETINTDSGTKYSYGLGIINRGNSYNNLKPITIKSIKNENKISDTYDITVVGEEFIVNDIISHNSNAEVCMLGTRGKVIKPATNKIASVVITPRQRHSSKPTIIRDLINKLYPDLNKVELFAREYSDGWTSTGLDLDGKDIRDFISEQSL